MKQLTQNYKTGKINVEDVPMPVVRSGCVLVKNCISLISVGTERSKVQMGKKNLIQKAFSRPDLAKQVLLKVRQEGIVSVFHKVMHRLEAASPLGYSCTGRIIEVGENVGGFNVGDRVACAGAGFANHSEYICVPVNLCVGVPEDVGLEEAAFTTIGAIALQGVRQSGVKLGENVCVIGLGLLGQVTTQILLAAGCRVLGIDIDEDKVRLAQNLGITKSVLFRNDIEKITHNFTNGFGFDSVIITAASISNDPIILAGKICRDRARVVIVGDVRIDIPRRDYYQKELQVIMSRSYGPGRYDSLYEEKGIDYPIGYVRWTEKRNMEEFLHLVDERKIKIDQLITHRFRIEDAPQAYEIISGKRKESCLGIILEYTQEEKIEPKHISIQPITRSENRPLGQIRKEFSDGVKMGFIGAGNFASGVLLPNITKIKDAQLSAICSASGLSAKNAAVKFGFHYAASSIEEILKDNNINTVFIVTTHNLHSQLTVKSLNAQKVTFVEKPLCLTKEELKEIMDAASCNPNLMVGFNRRFSAHTKFVRESLNQRQGNCVVSCRVNAGTIPKNSWIYDPDIGGGRVLSEVCHFVDLLYYLIGAKPEWVFAYNLGGKDPDVRLSDNLIVSIKFSDGSLGSIIYTSKGDVASGKEYIEIFADGAVLKIDDFKISTISRNGRIRRFKSTGQDKGHQEELRQFIEAAKAVKSMPISVEEIYYSTLTTLSIIDTFHRNQPIKIE